MLGPVPTGEPAPRRATRNAQPSPSKARRRRTSTPNDVRRSRPYPPPPERFAREFPLRFRQNVVAGWSARSPPRDKRRVWQRLVIVRSNGASQCQGGLDVWRGDVAVVLGDPRGPPVRGALHPPPPPGPPS